MIFWRFSTIPSLQKSSFRSRPNFPNLVIFIRGLRLGRKFYQLKWNQRTVNYPPSCSCSMSFFCLFRLNSYESANGAGYSMFYQLLYIHLYRPFLKYTKSTSPLPNHVSPRRLCSQAAAAISKLLRVYKKSYGLRQICNIAVYIVHTACTIHLLNLPDRNARRDLIHGVRNLEEIGEGWLCARRTLRILELSATKWRIELPPEVSSVLDRTRLRWGSWGSWIQVTSPSASDASSSSTNASMNIPATYKNHENVYHPPAALSQPSMASSLYTRSPAYSTMPVAQQQQSFAVSMSSANYATEPTSLPLTGYPPVPERASTPTNMSHVLTNRGMSYVQSVPGYQNHQQDIGGSPDVMNMNNQSKSCNNSISSNSPAPISSTPPMPVFSGMNENQFEDTQGWWMDDQSSLALGMENWGEGWAGNQFMNVNLSGPQSSNPLFSRSSSSLHLAPQNRHHSLHSDDHNALNMHQVNGRVSLDDLRVSGNLSQDPSKHGYGFSNMHAPGYQ